jgi:hypothetical protein
MQRLSFPVPMATGANRFTPCREQKRNLTPPQRHKMVSEKSSSLRKEPAILQNRACKRENVILLLRTKNPSFFPVESKGPLVSKVLSKPRHRDPSVLALLPNGELPGVHRFCRIYAFHKRCEIVNMSTNSKSFKRCILHVAVASA